MKGWTGLLYNECDDGAWDFFHAYFCNALQLGFVPLVFVLVTVPYLSHCVLLLSGSYFNADLNTVEVERNSCHLLYRIYANVEAVVLTLHLLRIPEQETLCSGLEI